MHPFIFNRRSPHSIVVAALLWTFSDVGNATAQNTEPSAGRMQEERRDVQEQGQPPKRDQANGPAQAGLGKEDSNMMRSMAKTNIAEIQLAGLAHAISENRIVREYAQRMLDDHGRALDELKKLAAEKNVVLPGGPDEDHVVAARQLAIMKGDDFNRKYLAHAGAEAHEKSLQLFQDVGEHAADGAVKSYATKTVLTIDRHLKLAKQAQQSYEAPRTSAK